MRDLLNHWSLKSALCLGISLATTGIVSAQAIVTAQRGAELAPFFETTLLTPDWGPTNNIGYTAGVDYTRYLRSIVQPGIELRFANANGLTVSERSFTGGLKLGTTVYGLHPYATLLAGTGTITFTHPIDTYLFDTSFVYSIGAGMEFGLPHGWKMRTDFVQQNWNLDPHQLTPIALSVGFSYRVPFRAGGWEH
jgi:hypothetical protein